ncbi:S41 family peptidase [Larkinella rosea]|uniref:Tail specific protease domain-containing protein n=1 Tax=Larkinella rosea TaxID=2025312 RepID=A0A3P1BJ31_9BACT|nr:S41 family peptidase [Larkinella rosea]RRB01139.1 hypothetical protein EHT25_23480 [Larkinella rosea]
MKRTKRPATWAWLRIACWVLLVVRTPLAWAQKQLPVVRATARSVDVRDGGIVRKGVWNLSPEIRPDIYYVLEPVRPRRITFYTDIDSLSFDVVPGQNYDFLIVLNKTDTCYTRIETAKPVVQTQASSDPLKRFSVDQVRQDFTLFCENLRQQHAGLYRYRSKKEMDRLLDSCHATLSHSMTSTEFSNTIRFVISAIGCGHTNCSLPAELMDWYGTSAKMFPLQLWFSGRKAFSLCTSRTGIPAKSEVTAIDGRPIDEIRQTLFRYLPSDGRIQSRKYWIMNRDGFPFLYRFIYGDKTAFRVTYKTPTGAIQTTSLSADSLKNTSCFQYNSGSEKLLQLTYTADNVALLTIKTFSNDRLKASRDDFETFLKTAFKELQAKNVSRLLIDLRGNGGGDDVNGSLLYSYLTTKPFAYFASLQSTTQTFLNKTDHPGLEMQNPSENNYKGAVYFLIDGLSFSTTADFCAIAKSNHRGTFIGEETGGGYAGNNSGEMFRITLPNTAIRISIPKIRYANAVKKVTPDDRGVIPDYPVNPTINELLQKRDVALEFAVDRARMRKRSK